MQFPIQREKSGRYQSDLAAEGTLRLRDFFRHVRQIKERLDEKEGRKAKKTTAVLSRERNSAPAARLREKRYPSLNDLVIHYSMIGSPGLRSSSFHCNSTALWHSPLRLSLSYHISLSLELSLSLFVTGKREDHGVGKKASLRWRRDTLRRDHLPPSRSPTLLSPPDIHDSLSLDCCTATAMSLHRRYCTGVLSLSFPFSLPVVSSAHGRSSVSRLTTWKP